MPAKRKKRLKWSRRSAQDLLNIEGYIARDNLAAADAVVAHIKQRAILLESEPLLGKRRLTTSHRELVLTTNLNATSLYRTLSPRGNPELKSLRALLKAMGMRLAVQPVRVRGARRLRAAA